MGYSRKKTKKQTGGWEGEGIEDMEFPGVSKK